MRKTNKDILSPDDILALITDYEAKEVHEYNKLWDYYKGEDDILNRKVNDVDNPDNKIAVPYGRKIIKTYTGYAFRPNYITYKPTSDNIEYYNKIQENFHMNKEHIKTSRAGRNSGIFGVAYELVYIEKEVKDLTIKAEPKFFSIDPREMILLYDFSSEPQKKIAIRFYKIQSDKYIVEVYYADKIIIYYRTFVDNNWKLTLDAEYPNFFKEIPVAAYYFEDDSLGIIKPVLSLIDAYDVLISDSMNEFDRFSNAYLIMKRFGITDPTKKKTPGVVADALRFLKRSRIFENLPSDAEIKFLTKEIPTGFVDYMTKCIRDQIHIQSHVPDFSGEKFAAASGIAIQRMMFDFENMVASAEADFDIGLYERISLITKIYNIISNIEGKPHEISIQHKRNIPANLKEYADTAVSLKAAGFSKYLIADTMPDDIIPDVEEELSRQDKDQEALMPDVSNYPSPPQIFDDGNGGFVDQNGNPIDQNGNPLPP